MRTRAYRAAEAIRHSLRNGFTAYNALSPVTGFLATVISGTYRKLDASTGASGPHDFAVRVRAVRQRHIGVHRIPSRAYDDSRNAPRIGTGRNRYIADLASWSSDISVNRKYRCSANRVSP